MKRNILVGMLFTLILGCNNKMNNLKIGIDDYVYRKYSGVWDRYINATLINDVKTSWGIVKEVGANGSFIIDLGCKEPYIQMEGGGEVLIEKVEAVSDYSIKLIVKDRSIKSKGTYLLKLKDENRIEIIESLTPNYIANNHIIVSRRNEHVKNFV